MLGTLTAQRICEIESQILGFVLLFHKKIYFFQGGVRNDFQRLGVLSFDPQANFASILMSGFFSNFSKKYVFGRSKDGDMIFSVKSQIFMEFL